MKHESQVATGIELYNVKKLVETMIGKIIWESIQNQGVKFNLFL